MEEFPKYFITINLEAEVAPGKFSLIEREMPLYEFYDICEQYHLNPEWDEEGNITRIDEDLTKCIDE